MEVIDFRTLVQKGIVRNYSVLRVNASGYPFVTILNKANRASNLYFSKNSSQNVLDTFGEENDITEFLKTAQVVKTANADGDVRYKLSSSGDYKSSSSLADAFGVQLEQTDFDLNEFAKQFETQTISA
jgi:hypothetical protein